MASVMNRVLIYSQQLLNSMRSFESLQERDHEVPKPVRSGGEGHAWSTVLCRVKFGDGSPHKGTPGASKCRNEQTREDDQSRSGLRRVRRVFLVEGIMTHESIDTVIRC